MDTENKDDQDQSGESDETLSTQDMDEVAGGGCMVFIDSAGCSNSGSGGGGGGGGGGATSGSGTGTGKGHG